MHHLILLFIGGTILTLGDIVFKYWIDNDSWKLFLGGLSLYIIGMLFLVATFKTQNIAVASVIFILFNIATLTIASYFLFHEPIPFWKTIGLLVGLVAVIILELAE